MNHIMNHKWVKQMDEEDKANVLITESPESDFSEEVLNMMLARGIDREKTIQVGQFLFFQITSYSLGIPHWLKAQLELNSDVDI